MRLLVACITAFALLVPSKAAALAYDPVGSGATTITLAKPFLSLLQRHQVTIEVRGGAKRSGRRIVLSASGGTINSRRGAGTVDSGGAVIFRSGRRKLPFRSISFKSQRTPLYAKVEGGKLKLAVAARVRARRAGFGASFRASQLRLTAKVAERMNKKLGLGETLSRGELIGNVAAVAQPTTVHLEPTGRLSLSFDPAFYRKLNDLFVSLNPIAPAELTAGPALTFPIGLESTLAPDGSSGVVKLGGATELLRLGSAQYFWRELSLQPAVAGLAAETDLEPTPPWPGPSPQEVLLVLLPGGSASADPRQRAISISGRPAALSANTAAALNSAFGEGKAVFAPGEIVGSVSLVALAE